MKKLLALIVLASWIGLYSCDTLSSSDTLEKDLSLKSGQKVMSFKAHLTSDQETGAVESLATGEAILKLSKDGTMLSYKLIVANIDNVIASHIHLAAPGVNGPVKIPLYTSGLIEGTSNGILVEGEAPIDESLLNAMMAGNTYVNVHTVAYPGGEIRGQISAN